VDNLLGAGRMENDTKKPLSHRRKSDSRQMKKRTTIRWSDDEYKTLELAADASGLMLGSYIRDCILKSPKTKKRRRPLADVDALKKLHGELNRSGGNINQIAKSLNLGGTPLAAEILQTLAAHREILALIRGAVGRER